MKTEESLSKSADAALKEAVKEAENFLDDLYALGECEGQEQLGKVMPRVRSRLAVITQRLHEFNAYTVARDTK